MPFEWQLGWRYTRAARGGVRNGFISFISAVSVLGIAVGVAALIIILSVMNGFQKDVRDRMLSVIPHVEISRNDGTGLENWRQTAAQAQRLEPAVVGAAPFVATQALMTFGQVQRGVQVRGVEPSDEAAVTPLGAQSEGPLASLKAGQWRVVLGGELARQLGVSSGDRVTLVAPAGQVSPAGLVPRLKQFTVSATVDSGHFEFDSVLALIHIEDAARLFRTGGPTGVQLKLSDQQAARSVAARLLQALAAEQLTASDWTRSNQNWYAAVQVEKRLMAIILTLIVAVAAFNLVSTLVMTVTDKRADIAILRTLGASPRSVMGIFIVQGALSGVVGTVAGVALGLGVALHIDTIVPAVERALGLAFLPDSIYVISRMPSHVLASDIVPITLWSLLLAFLATLYPSWRASLVQPAEALRYE